MNTRGWTGGRPNFFLFFTFLLFLSKSAKRRESLFEQNENIFFNFHVREKKKKWGKSIESPKKKKHCTAALTIIRECVCVYSSHLILINEKRRRENWVIYNTIDNNIIIEEEEVKEEDEERHHHGGWNSGAKTEAFVSRRRNEVFALYAPKLASSWRSTDGCLESRDVLFASRWLLAFIHARFSRGNVRGSQ